MAFFNKSEKLDTQYSVAKAVGAPWLEDQKQKDVWVEISKAHYYYQSNTGKLHNERGTRLWDTGLIQSVYRSLGLYQEMEVSSFLKWSGRLITKSIVLRVTIASKKKCDQKGLFYKVPNKTKNVYPVNILSEVIEEFENK